MRSTRRPPCTFHERHTKTRPAAQTRPAAPAEGHQPHAHRSRGAARRGFEDAHGRCLVSAADHAPAVRCRSGGMGAIERELVSVEAGGARCAADARLSRGRARWVRTIHADRRADAVCLHGALDAAHARRPGRLHLDRVSGVSRYRAAQRKLVRLDVAEDDRVLLPRARGARRGAARGQRRGISPADGFDDRGVHASRRDVRPQLRARRRSVVDRRVSDH